MFNYTFEDVVKESQQRKWAIFPIDTSNIVISVTKLRTLIAGLENPQVKTNGSLRISVVAGFDFLGSILVRWKFWISILIVAVFTGPQIAFGISWKEAELVPMLNSKGVNVINPTDPVVYPSDAFGPRSLSVPEKRDSWGLSWSKYSRNSVEYRNARCAGDFPEQKLILLEFCKRSLIPLPYGTENAGREPELNITRLCFSKVLQVYLVCKHGREFSGLRRVQHWGYGLYFEPSSLINTKRFSAPSKSLAGDPALSYHLTPHQKRYEGIDDKCHERRPSVLFYTLLSGIVAAGFGLRISYGIFVEGDNRSYLYGLIGPWFVLPLCALAIMYGLGVLLNCFLYFTSPCPDTVLGIEDTQMANILLMEKPTISPSFGTMIGTTPSRTRTQL